MYEKIIFKNARYINDWKSMTTLVEISLLKFHVIMQWYWYTIISMIIVKDATYWTNFLDFFHIIASASYSLFSIYEYPIIKNKTIDELVNIQTDENASHGAF